MRDVEHERRRVESDASAQRCEEGLARREARSAGLERPSRTAWRSARSFQNRHVRLHMILNAYWEPLDFELPPVTDGGKSMAPMDRYCSRPAARNRRLADGSAG